MPRRGPAPQIGLSTLMFLLGLLVAVGLAKEKVREREEPERRVALAALVRDRQVAVRELRSELARLDRRLSGLRRRASGGSTELRSLLGSLDELEGIAGVAAMRGPGVVVQLRDSSRAPATRQEAADLVVHDVDLQLVVNALWRSGAEAVEVNGERVAAITAIRSAGERVLVNFSPVASPYTVSAIGDPARLRRGFGGSEISQRFEVWSQAYGLGFDVREARSISVPRLDVAPGGFAEPA